MFDRIKKTIILRGKEEKIIEFSCWFQTPFGLFDQYDTAVKRLIADDMDVTSCLKPVAVAISETLYEVVG